MTSPVNLTEPVVEGIIMKRLSKPNPIFGEEDTYKPKQSIFSGWKVGFRNTDHLRTYYIIPNDALLEGL